MGSEHLIQQLTKGFELVEYRTKPWITVKKNGRRIGIVHNGLEVGLWLKEPNDVSKTVLFAITKPYLAGRAPRVRGRSGVLRPACPSHGRTSGHPRPRPGATPGC
jgi:hypothetical protein